MGLFVYRNLIDGVFVEPPEVDTLEVESPRSGEILGRVPLSGKAEVDEAVGAAMVAQAAWRNTPLKERCQLLYRLRELMRRDLTSLAETVARECGKTTEEARAELDKGLEVAQFAMGLENMDAGGALEVSRGVTCELRREPLGVVAGITPFNFPAMVPMWMFPIAITVGNAFILKPSEKVPVTACRLGELMSEAGFPKGIFSIVHGGEAAANALVDHDRVAAVGFVGSSRIAGRVYARAAERGKRALALGGAKNHMILAPDADRAIAVDGVVRSFTACAGQRCMAGSVLLAVGDVDGLIDGIVEQASRVALGKDMGAIIDRAAVERLRADVTQAEEAGATIRLDGRQVTPPAGLEAGHWFGPTILDRALPEMECVRKELFGPVLTIVRVPTLEDALDLDAQSPYGNATSVFTTRGAVARRVVERSTTGMVGINVGVPVPREPFSFGGTKTSRFGHGDITGEGAVAFWSQLKKITSKWSLHADQSWMS